MNELIKNGEITRPYLGVSLTSVEEIPQYYLQNVMEDAKSGAMVTGVETNSAAAAAGFQQQDIIVAVDGVEVTTAAELRKQLYMKEIGDNVSFSVYRGTNKITVTATLQK